MNSPIFMRAKICISVLLSFASMMTSAEEWKVDFSRRAKPEESKTATEVGGESSFVTESKNFVVGLFDSSEPVQEMVILNTEKGFVPATVRVRQNGNYRIHVVNVNEKDKNISFVLDAFSEHHATYFGKLKTFEIRPKKTGVFRFISPETSAQGRLVVYPAPESNQGPPADVRAPAAESE